MQKIDVESATGWLKSADPMGMTIGYNAPGWAASAWVLDAMYENGSFPENVTANARLRVEARKAGGGHRIADGFDLETLDLTALELDSSFDGFSIRSARPASPRWTRLKWRDLATRLGLDLGCQDGMLGSEWFKDFVWPARITSPEEGSLDREQFAALVRS